MSPQRTERKPVLGHRPPPFTGRSVGLLTGIARLVSVVVGRFVQSGELELAVTDPAIVQPVALEQLVVKQAPGDVGVGAAGAGRPAADLLHPFPYPPAVHPP